MRQASLSHLRYHPDRAPTRSAAVRSAPCTRGDTDPPGAELRCVSRRGAVGIVRVAGLGGHRSDGCGGDCQQAHRRCAGEAGQQQDRYERELHRVIPRSRQSGVQVIRILRDRGGSSAVTMTVVASSMPLAGTRSTRSDAGRPRGLFGVDDPGEVVEFGVAEVRAGGRHDLVADDVGRLRTPQGGRDLRGEPHRVGEGRQRAGYGPVDRWQWNTGSGQARRGPDS